MSHDGKITKNTLYLSSAYVVQKLLAFVYFALLARFLGADNIGKYVFALSFTTIFSIFIDLGLSSVLIREIAKFRDKAKDYISNVIGAKILLAIMTYGLTIFFVNILNYPLATRQLVYLSGFIMILDSFTLSFYAVLRGFQKIKFEGLGTIIHQLIVISLGFLAIKLGLPIIFFIGVVLCASAFNFLFSLSLLIFKEKIAIKPTWQRETIKMLFIIALPFAIAGIFSRVYSYIDQILLSKLAGDTALGIYSVAYKLTFALQFIPAAFGASIFPAFANFYANSREHLAQTFEKAIRYLTILVMPISLGTIVLAREIILKIYGQEYVLSILPLQILIIALIFIFINYPLGALLNACDHQKTNTYNVGIAMLINIILNVILIPKFSFIGASLAVLVSYVCLVGINFYYVPQILEYKLSRLLWLFLKTLTAAAIMAIIIYCAKSFINFWWLIIPGGLIYFVMIYLFGLISKNDLASIFNIFKRKNENISY
ncbi:MAG: flippase [Patescibacteria group bacterium]